MAAGYGARFCLAYRQFNALMRKNAILKFRTWWQLIPELIIPILFMFALVQIKTTFTTSTIDAVVPQEVPAPLPLMSHLLNHTEYPNVLCHDHNIFYRCFCEEEEGENNAYLYLDEFGPYVWTPGALYWNNMHPFRYHQNGICGLGAYLVSGSTTDDSDDDRRELAEELWRRLNGNSTDSSMIATYYDALCGDTNDLELIHSASLFFLDMFVDYDLEDLLDLEGTIAADEIEQKCEQQAFALAPETDDSTLNSIVSSFESFISEKYPRLSDFVYVFESEAAMKQHIQQADYSQDESISPKVGSAVVFHAGSPNWDYAVRSNYTKTDRINYYQENVPTTSDKTNAFLKNYYETPDTDDGRTAYQFNREYFVSNNLAIQMLVDEFIYHYEQDGGVLDGIEAKLPNFFLGNFPSPSYEEDTFWATLASTFAIFMTLAMMYPILNVIKQIVQEKELKLKEGMRMMGLSATAHMLSWWAHFTILFICLAILLTMVGASLFEYSDSSLIFWYFMWFFMASVSFCFFISAFFSRARTASIIGSMAFFASLFPYFGVSSGTNAQKTATCLLPASCLAIGTDAFSAYEDASIGVTFNTAGDSSQGVAFNTVIGMLFFDWILYGFLAWYFNQVLPSEWGTHKKFYFLFQPSYWCPGKAGASTLESAREALISKEESVNNPNVQAVADDIKTQIESGDCVAMRGLRKVFKTPTGEKVAVKDFNLTMYSGQITALLGHNGAGKTTTISMLTGMIPTTAGNSFIKGKDVETEMKDIRKNLGVCPQHDILYPNLTVKEHLRMYASFKGVPRSEVNDAVDKMIKEVGLTEKVNTRSKNLSGGQKRKLSVGIAFMGDSKVVFLDEPTSGMDPYSRRFTWDVIRRNREGRVIVLTTHFMDEADLLGDRIAIMADGELRCCGSSLFLKSRFGVGYNLTLVKKMKDAFDSFAINPLMQKPGPSDEIEEKDELEDVGAGLSLCDENGVVDLVRTHVPHFKLLSNVGAEMTFQLPQNSSKAFKDLLTGLDDSLISLGVESYGISVTTLEEVFIKVAAGMHDVETKRQLSKAKLSRERSRSRSLSAGGKNRAESLWDVDESWKNERIQGFSLFLLHLRTLITKRFWNYKRDWKALSLTILLPAVFILLGLAILQIDSDSVQPSLTLDLTDSYNTGVQTTQNPVFYAVENCTFDSDGSCPAVDSLMDEMIGASPVQIDLEDNSFISVSEYVDFVGDTLLETNEDYEASRYGAFSFLSSENDVYDVVLHTNYTALHSFPLFMSALNEALLRLLSDSDITITVREYPLPETSTNSEISEGIDGFTVTLFMLIAFAFVPAGYAQYIIREKEQKTKHQQVVSGVSLNAYWISSYLWDFVCYLLGPMLLTIILLAAFDVEALILGKGGAAVFMVLLMFGLAIIPFTYLMTFMFRSAAVGTVIVILANWILGLMLTIVCFILMLIPSTMDDAKHLRHFFRLFPQFCFGDAMLWISFRTFFDGASPWDNQIAGYDLAYLAWEIPVYFILVLVLERMLAGSNPLAQKIDNLRLRAKRYEPSTIDPSQIDEDVLREEERVRSGNANNDVIQINNLRKAFPNPLGASGCKEAVKGITLGIPRGQCFGLLGINGAGKTTTLTILSGEQPPTEGYGLLNGLDISENAEEVHKLVGYCPQFDAIFPSLSARENLKIYGRLKGIPENRLDKMVEQTIRQMSLVEYADRISGSFSGGNKRKLSVGIAMIGGPELIFLDEPSTGMDPVARRFMWDVITKISTERAQCAIILTTHSMEECEALCTRIGIMVGGRLRCLGAAQHLKTRFGLGFQLEIGLRLPNETEVSEVVNRISQGVERLDRNGVSQALTTLGCDANAWMAKFSEHGSAAVLNHELEAMGSVLVSDLASYFVLETRALFAEHFVFTNFPGTVLRERQSGKARFEFPPQNMPLGQMFGLLEDNRVELNIEEYSLSQTTLEQIFNFFASQQEEETGPATGIVQRASTMMGSAKVHQSINEQENNSVEPIV
mmetsp:Transcript_6325/g.7912  ORF Transcript_6325/g.7912 Transcript_6325/m.7912 type:complete len:1988 (-) Transcript_6325:343-6306(-)